MTCLAWGHHPVCPPLPRVLAGRCSSSLSLIMTGTHGLGQHTGCLLGTGWRAGPTILEVFGVRFPPWLARTQLGWRERSGRNPPVSARLHEREGRGSLSSSPNSVPLAGLGSHYPTVHTQSLAPRPRAPGSSRGCQCSQPVQTRELPHKERGAKPKDPFTTRPDAGLGEIKALPRSSPL